MDAVDGKSALEWAYAEHLIEHITPDQAITWLREVRRMLLPGGLLRLTTPDLRKYAEGYLTDTSFFTDHRQRCRRPWRRLR